MARRKGTNGAKRAVGGELRGFVERYEKLTAEMAEVGDARKAVMAEAKAAGYDTKVMRIIIRERTRSAEDLSEERAVAALYREALGMEGTPLDEWAGEREAEEAPDAAPAKSRGRKSVLIFEGAKSRKGRSPAPGGPGGDEPPPPEAA